MKVLSLTIFNNKDTGNAAVDYCGELHIVFCKIKRIIINGSTILKLKGSFPSGKRSFRIQAENVRTSITNR